MSPLENALQQALALSPADQASLYQALEERLIEHAQAEGADEMSGEENLAELNRRVAAYRSGDMSARDVADVLAGWRERFRQQ